MTTKQIFDRLRDYAHANGLPHWTIKDRMEAAKHLQTQTN